MKKSEIIHILKDPIKSVIEKVGKGSVAPNFASNMVALALYTYDNGGITDADIRDKNNPFGLQDPSTGEILSFATLEESILQCMGNDMDDKKEEFEAICKANNLYRLDKEFLATIKGSIIDIDKTPNFDQYTVKDVTGADIAKTMNLEEAIEVKETAVKKPAKIYNSRGTIIDGGKKDMSTNKAKIVSINLMAGTAIELNGHNIYAKPRDKFPSRAISGTFYLYDGKPVNGRYAICLKREFVGESTNCIVGYVNGKDLK